jgi:hypothetical protein
LSNKVAPVLRTQTGIHAQNPLAGIDDGRSRSFFCRAAALLDAKALKGSICEAKEARASETGNKAKTLKGILESCSP